jgi:intraflagellar transport protein 80
MCFSRSSFSVIFGTESLRTPPALRVVACRLCPAAMKLDVAQVQRHHNELVSAVEFSPSNEVIAASDDKTISMWSTSGELVKPKLVQMDTYVTSLHWQPSSQNMVADIFVAACTDGCFYLVNRSGRIEKKVSAHRGAIVCARWSYDGSAIVTGGEDGAVKTFSRTGQLRATIMKSKFPIYTVKWAPDDDQLLFSQGKDLLVKATKIERKHLQWKAHDGVVTEADWNPANGKIVSCGEDCRYKVWDTFGRLLYSSSPFDYVLTSCAWSPSGACFAVGSYNFLRLCDHTGWSYSRSRIESGSIMRIAWSDDGTSCAGAGGDGSVVVSTLVNRRLEWKSVEVTLTGATRIEVTNCVTENSEKIDFRARVVDMSIGFGRLIVTTATQCHIYSVDNYNTPHIFDLRHPPTMIVQSDRLFLTVDGSSGVQVYNYEGRPLSNPRFKGLRTDRLTERHISLCADKIAILNPSAKKTFMVFDVHTGQPRGKPVQHTREILELDLSQYTASRDPMISFVDSNRDLHVVKVGQKPVKLATMCDTSEWNDSSDMLSAICDGKLVTWVYPHAVYVDQRLLERTKIVSDAAKFGKRPYIVSNFGSRVTVRRSDGALATASVSHYPPILYGFVVKQRWEEAVRLCRFVKRDELWAALAAMALWGRHLETAEIALAAVAEMAKLEFVLHVKQIPIEEGRSAELALLRGAVDEAESILMQAQPPLVYRAIKLNITLFRWTRALQLAVQNQTHVDTVLAYRQRHLERWGKRETDEQFIKYAKKVEVNWDAIEAKKQQEIEKERSRGRIADKRGMGK